MKKTFFYLLCSLFAYAAINAQEPALMAASRAGNLEEVQRLLAAGANVNEQNNIGDAALHIAPYEVITELLILYGAKVNLENKGGATPLYSAVLYNRLDVVRCLLKHGAIVTNHIQLPLPEHGAGIANHFCAIAIRTLALATAKRGIAMFKSEIKKNHEGISVTNQDISLFDAGVATIAPLGNLSHMFAMAQIPPLEIAALRHNPEMTQLLESWLHIADCTKDQRKALCMALHPRVGAGSPLQLLSPFAIREICDYVKPATFIDDQEAVDAYSHMQPEEPKSYMRSLKQLLTKLTLK